MSPSTHDAAQRIAHELRLLVIHAVTYSHQASGALGLSSSESEVLNLLGLEGSQAAGEIARSTGLSTGTVTGLLDRLEGRGFIHRERHQTDRRKVIVTADPDALAQVGRMFDAHEQALASALEGYETDQMETIAGFLAHLTEAARQHPFRPDSSPAAVPVAPDLHK